LAVFVAKTLQAPPGRKETGTYVLKMNDDVIREAINAEMARGGQTFYVVSFMCFDARVGDSAL
jgi:transcription-repair coupling factor (superfamily II helicase)